MPVIKRFIMLLAGVLLSSQSLADLTVETVVRAPVDEWYYGIGDSRNRWLPEATLQGPGEARPEGAVAKRNGGYAWAMAAVEDKLWFSSLNNGWCGWMMVTGQLLPTENSQWVCETYDSHYPEQAAEHENIPWPEGASFLQKDWRPPAIYWHDTKTGVTRQVHSDHPAYLDIVSRSFGFRAAGSANGIVFMASNPLVRDDKSIFILAFDGLTGEFIDGVQLANYVNVRRFRILKHPDGSEALYLLVGSEMHSSDHPNHLLRWTGSRDSPFGNKNTPSATPGFDIVGDLGQAGSGVELLQHRGRLLVTTWGSETVPAGLYQSNPLPRRGFSLREPARFSKVLDASDFDPDLTIAQSWLIGAIEEFDGYIYWGTMHPNGQGFQKLLMRDPMILFSARESILKSHRRTHLFRTDFSNPEQPRTELLYGEANLWAYDDGQWFEKPNRLNLTPLFGASGFGEYLNDYIWTMVNYAGSLYVGTFDVSGGIKMIREETDCQLSCLVLRTLAGHATEQSQTPGFDLYRFDAAGRAAVTVTKDGFGNSTNNGVRNAIVINGALYLGSSTFSNLDHEHGRSGWELLKLTKVRNDQGNQQAD